MKVSYSSLRCPHCGSSSFDLVYDDIFLCDYCGEKFNVSIDSIEFNSENKILISELKEQFDKKIKLLNNEKNSYYKALIYYKNLANPKFFLILSIMCFIISVLLMIVTMSYNIPKSIGVILISVSTIMIVLAKIHIFIRQKKYKPYIILAANKQLEYEEKIESYSHLVSMLTK